MNVISAHKLLKAKYKPALKLLKRMFFEDVKRHDLNKQFVEEFPNLHEKLAKNIGCTSFYRISAESLHTLISGETRNVCLNKDCDNECGYEYAKRKFKEFCSKQCYNRSPENKKRRERTLIERYGVDNPYKSKEVQRKIAKTNKEKYGTENISSSTIIKQRKRETCKKNWGASHHMKSKKGKATFTKAFRDKYGVNNPMQVQFIATKVRDTLEKRYGVRNPNDITGMSEKRLNSYIRTCMAKYGVENSSQSIKVLSKYRTATYSKETIELCGREIAVQGYEGYVLTKLYEIKPFANISTIPKHIGSVFYKHKNKNRVYFPDAIIKMNDGRKRIVEIKSWFTLGKDSCTSKFKTATTFYNKRGIDFYVVVAEPATDTLLIIKNPGPEVKHLVRAAQQLKITRYKW